ncbi:MAG: dTDP-glucose 4,6-dehydratase [Deltaproteobacteria bacterium 13_1_40CM_4_68_19]|nr:MAG: dTDP-glucose 4,6-dehydratase [Deltaproteobacteria bacterium 13_1_40CM_4_68_19]OLD46187.1 MAG: dTDP-glucose 4,6-dehydratase [Chloroflexi bacterium 13_1_40CM_2_68_14]
MTRTVLVTGGAGFIGSNLARFLRRERPEWKVVNLDKLTYAGNAESVADLRQDPGHVFVRGDIANAELVEHLIRHHAVDAILNLAAESHVDRSILGPGIFVQTNVSGTQVLLEAARTARVKRFLQISTDEVYGSLGASGKFTEASTLRPSSPYSASKAAADLLVLAYGHTFGLDVVVTRCSNNYGPYQFPEKLIPLMIANALEGRRLPVYGDGMQVRDWIHVEDHCRALLAALEMGRGGEIYNIGSDNEWPNIQIVGRLLEILQKPRELIEHVKDRPGHDRRYAIDAAKARAELGWSPHIAFPDGLKGTVEWYLQNRGWWERVRTGDYRTYYDRNYGAR